MNGKRHGNDMSKKVKLCCCQQSKTNRQSEIQLEAYMESEVSFLSYLSFLFFGFIYLSKLWKREGV